MAEVYRNKKNKKLYVVLHKELINCTNKVDGQEMILYTLLGDSNKKFCREKNEFFEKFTKEELE